jgi:leucine dehydrogenase
MGGNYITGEDVGTTCADMVEIRAATTYVMGLPQEQGGSGDPSRSTATGCFEGIRASLWHALKRDSLANVHVAVQGVGNVGFNLCEILAAAGARLSIADSDEERVERCAQAVGATIVDPALIYDVEADVFAPCALGAVLNAKTVSRLRARIVAGGANNQLESTHSGAMLRERKILYAPDYVINAGGMIQLAAERTGVGLVGLDQRVRQIHGTLLRVYRLAEDMNVTTNIAADTLAAQRLARPRT